MFIIWGHRANSSISRRNSYLGKMGQSGVRPIGNLFWDIDLIASYLLYWSLVIYPMSGELRGTLELCHSVLPNGRHSTSTSTRCIVLYSLPPSRWQLVSVFPQCKVCYVQECVTASFGRALSELRDGGIPPGRRQLAWRCPTGRS